MKIQQGDPPRKIRPKPDANPTTWDTKVGQRNPPHASQPRSQVHHLRFLGRKFPYYVQNREKRTREWQHREPRESSLDTEGDNVSRVTNQSYKL